MVKKSHSRIKIEQLIKNLKVSKLIAHCPLCEEVFKLSDALLFDGMGRFPPAAEERKLLLLQEFNERKKELSKRKIYADIGAEKKAIEVGFGKVIEKFIPAYKNLKLKFCECRPLYEPIDLIVFNGVTRRKVDFITFLEIKSGDSRLNHNQRIIRDAVLDGRIGLRVLK